MHKDDWRWLISTLTITLIGLCSLIFLALLLGNGPVGLPNLLLAIILALSGIYLFSRAGYVWEAAVLLTVFSVAAEIAAIILYPSQTSLAGLILPVLIASLFWPVGVVGTLAAILCGSALIICWNNGNIHAVVSTLIFVVFASSVICLVADLKDRVQRNARRRLEAERDFATQITNAVGEGIMVTNADGTFAYVNPAFAKMLGYSPADLLGRKAYDYIAEPHKPTLSGEFSLRKQAIMSIYETYFVHGDGHSLPVLLTSAPRREGEKVIGMITVVRDMTEAKRSEERERELAVERGRIEVLESYITEVSHDLRSPLTVMKTGLYLLEKADLTDQASGRVAQIKKYAERLEKMLADALSLSALERSSIDSQLNPSLCNLPNMLRDVVNDYQLVALHGDQKISFNPVDDPSPVVIDRDKMRRAVSNLVDNALRYTPPGGTIQVALRNLNGDVVIEVIDSGEGIPPEQLPNIFKRFYRGNKHRPTDGGVGLGLPIAQRIVEAHGGRIEVATSPGNGSNFSIHLPRQRLPIPMSLVNEPPVLAAPTPGS